MRDAEEKERALREEAWRQYWSGKRGEVKALFDQFDLDSSGFISRREMELVLPLLGGEGFFGYNDGVDSGDIDGMSAYVSDQLGEGGTGADALFVRLDTNQDDQISWEEVREGRWRRSTCTRMTGCPRVALASARTAAVARRDRPRSKRPSDLPANRVDS